MLIKISASLSVPIPNPIKECIVCPPIINAAVPVVAVSPTFLLSLFNKSIINFIVYDLPVPAGPVINIFSPFIVCSAANRCLLFSNSIGIRMYSLQSIKYTNQFFIFTITITITITIL